MQRKYLATLLAGLMTVPAVALADSGSSMPDMNIKLHAHLHGSIDYSNTGGSSVPNTAAYGESAGTPHRATNLSNNNSTVGFTGQHLVPGAFMAIFQVELALPGSQTGVNNSYGKGNHVSKNVGLHDTYFGIANPLGTLLFEPSFENQGAYLSRPFNMFKDTVGDFNSIIDTANFPNGEGAMPAISFAGQANYAIAYASPKVDGFDAVLAYSEDANGGDFGTNNTYGAGYSEGTGNPTSYGYPNANQHNNAWSLGIQYENEFTSLQSKVNGLINYSQINIQGSTANPMTELPYTTGPKGGTAAYVTGGIGKTITDSTGTNVGVQVPVYFDGQNATPPSSKLQLKALELAGKWDYEPTGTTAIAVWERSVGLYTRNAYSLGLSQAIPGNSDLMLSWIHAEDLSSPFANCGPELQGVVCSGGKVENSGANEYVAGVKHHFDKQVSAYLIYAYTRNNTNGMYGIGGPNHGQSEYPLKPGDNPQSLSLGMTWDF